jgi:protein ImuA
MAEAAVAREALFALRETIARLEGRPAPALAAAAYEDLAQGNPLPEKMSALKQQDRPPLMTGVVALDDAMQGGVPLDGLTEIRSPAFRDAGAATGFVLALTARLRMQEDAGAVGSSPVLWIGDTVGTMEAGLPYAIGLRDFGLEPQGFFHAAPRKLDEALWLAETAVASAAFAVVILEVRGNPVRFGLTESRRLSLRAKAARRPLFLLREAGEEEASSALFRLRIEPAPAMARSLPDGSMLGGSIGNPTFRLMLEKSRNPAPLSLTLEWNAHDRQFLPVLDAERPAFPGAWSAHSGAGLSASADRSDRPPEVGSVVAFDRAS